MKNKKIIPILLLFFLLLNCEEKTSDVSTKKYQDTIIRLKKENDSLISRNNNLKSELEKCDNWVDFLESK